MKTRVVNIKTGAKYDVYIGRAGHGKDGYFGNPFAITRTADRDQVIDDFKDYFFHRMMDEPEFMSRVRALKGKILGCFCVPLKCHGHVIAEWLDSQPDLVAAAQKASDKVGEWPEWKRGGSAAVAKTKVKK